jgi:hypothetical protein
LNFSIWEYGETFFGALVNYIFSQGLLISAISIVVPACLAAIILVLIQKVYKNLKFQEAFDKVNNLLIYRVVVTVLLFFYSIFIAYQDGNQTGFKVVTQASQPVTIYVNEYLMLPGLIDHITPDKDTSFYKITGLRLLTYNNGKYYLYEKLDSSCKPEKVFVIDNAPNIRSIELSSASPIDPQCKQ